MASSPRSKNGGKLSNSKKQQCFWQLLYHLIEPGSGKSFASWEIPLIYGSPLLILLICHSINDDYNDAWNSNFYALAIQNIKTQFILFLFMVQIPLLLTGKMTYVDLGWPTGLVLLACQVLMHNNSNSNNSGISIPLCLGILLLFHGGRLACGAYYVFFPYVFPKDLPRYEIAREKWIEKTENDTAIWLWKIKQQQETLLQAFANAFTIGIPVCLVATNPRGLGQEHNHIAMMLLEIVATSSWILFLSLENLADGQKIHFFLHATEDDRKTAVLGYPPYDKYWLWTWCRHPNYFCEWMCWNSLALMAVPSVWEFVLHFQEEQNALSMIVLLSLFLVLIYLSRLFYDCLRYWTGTEPAETRSVQRRPLYSNYQARTPPFFPRPPNLKTP
mmetsp:Transcript_26371/g.39953  ORF Transcript_26371/g.39953 Transcript_26371/m.39953 type:complete len:388 (-) Transcript_26371:117-1280(-)